MSDPVVVFGQVYEQPNGLAVVQPLQRALQVCHLDDGTTVITVTETGREPVLFALSEQLRVHFVSVLCRGAAAASAPPSISGQPVLGLDRHHGGEV